MDRIAQAAASALAGAFLLGTVRRNTSSQPAPHPEGPPVEVSPELGYKHREYHGICCPGFWVAQAVDDLRQNFQMDSQDIVIATYPKCGTTWLQQIMLLIAFHGDKSKVKDPMRQCPWIEMSACGKALNKSFKESLVSPIHPDDFRKITDTPRVTWKTHAPVGLAPWKGGMDGINGKVIVVVRNAKDAAVSLYHHTMDGGHWDFRGTWPDFCRMFLQGKVESGNFWEWYSAWWKLHQDRPEKILWVRFEHLKQDLRGQVERIAKFVGAELDEEQLDMVAAGSTFDAMKEQQKRIDAEKERNGERVKKNHIRQGKVGTWRGSFTDELKEIVEAFDDMDDKYGAKDWATLA